MSDRQQGDPHPDLDQRPDGAFYTGDLEAILPEVTAERIVRVTMTDTDLFTVELHEKDDSGMAEFGTAWSCVHALRYAVGAYLD